MTYAADPGGVFASDTHRRTLGHLSDSPLSDVGLCIRMGPDASTDLDADDCLDVLQDLEADGYASNTKAGWKQTKKGLDALNAPIGGPDG